MFKNIYNPTGISLSNKLNILVVNVINFKQIIYFHIFRKGNILLQMSGYPNPLLYFNTLSFSNLLGKGQ
jgi:hypothetical protein